MTANLPADKSKVRGNRVCPACGGFFLPRKAQVYCSTACRGEGQKSPDNRKRASLDKVAPAMVRDWPAEKRARIRARLLTEIEGFNRQVANNVGLVGLIDKITKEEAR